MVEIWQARGAGGSPRRVVLLLHGLLNDHRLWHAQQAALRPQADVLTPDFAEGTSMTALAQAILAEAPERFAVAGFSMGGYVACEIARIAPDRVAGLCLLASTSLIDTPAQRAARTATIAAVKRGSFEAVVNAVAQSAVWPDGAHARAAHAGLLAMARQVGPAKFAAHLQAVACRQGATDVLRALKCPITLARGDHDQIIRQDGIAATGVATGARITTIAGAGHMLPLEAPDRVSDLLQRWLDDIWQDRDPPDTQTTDSFVPDTRFR